MKILYATDGSPGAEAASSLLEKVADRRRVEVSVLCVEPPASRSQPGGISAREITQRAAERLTASGFVAEPRVVEGVPADEIVRLADEDATDLTLLGAGSKTWLDRILLGSVSSRVLHASTGSILIVREAHTGDPARVVVGTDGSESAAHAVDVLIDLADPDRCVITVLATAQIPAPALGGIGLGYPTTAFTPAIEAQLTADARAHADATAALLDEAGFSVEAKTVMGYAATRLLEEADAQAADVVVVGSRGMGRFDRAVLGSVSDGVVRHARAALVARSLPPPAS